MSKPLRAKTQWDLQAKRMFDRTIAASWDSTSQQVSECSQHHQKVISRMNEKTQSGETYAILKTPTSC